MVGVAAGRPNQCLAPYRFISAAAERPEIDDISEQIHVLGFVHAQEGKQAVRLAGAGA